ncbi:MAG: NTP transferase domain-containing protein, partial [Flavobacteriaceae bacterium]|nr:NTP transferase domain-containing protein [Flavobacteriaceae bacterium]
MTDNLIILAAGASSRMKMGTASNLSQSDIEQANNKSKGLIELSDGHPLLDYLLLNAAQAGFKNIYFVIGANSDEFKELYGHRRIDSFKNLQFKFATQEIP